MARPPAALPSAPGPNSFAARLRSCIGNDGLSAGAVRAGIHSSKLLGYLRGAEPRLSAVPALADALGVFPAWLAWGIGPRDEHDNDWQI